jgi:hypothetical protein
VVTLHAIVIHPPRCEIGRAPPGLRAHDGALARDWLSTSGAGSCRPPPAALTIISGRAESLIHAARVLGVPASRLLTA